MKKLVSIISLVLLFTIFFTSYAKAEKIEFTQAEIEWIEEHKNQTLHIGLAPYEGIDLFLYDDFEYGYLSQLADLISDETGLSLVIDSEKPWGEAYDGLINGEIEILFGANPTQERLEFMSFTESVYHYPYIALALKDSNIYTLGDLDNNRIGFIEGDMVIELFKEQYKNIHYTFLEYDDPVDGINALINNEIDGFITAGTEIIIESLYEYNSVKSIAELNSIYSEMTLSTLKENSLLASILNKVILNKQGEIEGAIKDAKVTYMHKILNLTDEEKKWIEEHPILRFGAPTDYLPIDYYNEDGSYEGVAGNFLNEFTQMLGIEIEAIPGTFDELYKKMLEGNIDGLNMAKTDDRMPLFIFTNPFSNDRDMIYGLKSNKTVYDIYGLEGATIAVIDGFWHDEYLIKNLKEVKIIHTSDISDSLRKVDDGVVDYMIENPTVAEYYIDGLGYNDIVSKGQTSSDSYLYFGMQKEHRPMVTIFNRALKLMDYEKAKYEGVQSSPEVKNLVNSRLTQLLLLIGLVLIVLVLVLINYIRAFIDQKTETNILKEREYLIYTDALTGLYNRLYFNSLEKDMDAFKFPQSFIVMDLNNLKLTNDSYGHKAGDQLIGEFARILKMFAKHDRIMRMGGDEFFIFLDDYTKEKTEDLIERIRLVCDDSVLELEDGTSLKGPRAAIGYAIRLNSDELPEVYLHLADQNMYSDKKKKRNEF